MSLTRQGVRNLNGPRMDGIHNGRSPTCIHFRVPDTEVERREEVVYVAPTPETGQGVRDLSALVTRKVQNYYCVSCGELRWTE